MRRASNPGSASSAELTTPDQLRPGHHATERYGVQALGAHLAQHFGVQHRFIEIDNPV